MSYKITCYTLFDITETGVKNRAKPADDQNIDIWVHKRNTQCNFDTVLQAISLRSQPESITKPEKNSIKFNNFEHFGFLFQQQEDEVYPCWAFEFTIQHPSVFNDGINELGFLYSDCDKVPMIKCHSEWAKLPNFLDTSEELRNIYFAVKYYE